MEDEERQDSLREVWQNESADFTPWLDGEDNPRLLGDTLGIELQLESLEKEVGPCRADIVCKDTADESWELIENQLTATNHNHLGQILTCAAGLDAVTISPSLAAADFCTLCVSVPAARSLLGLGFRPHRSWNSSRHRDALDL